MAKRKHPFDFDDLEWRDFDLVNDGEGYERDKKEVPKKLTKIDSSESPKISLGFGDLWNILKCRLRKQALIELGYESSDIGKVRTIVFVVLLCLIVLVVLAFKIF